MTDPIHFRECLIVSLHRVTYRKKHRTIIRDNLVLYGLLHNKA